MDRSKEAIIDALGRTMIDSPEEPVPHLPLEILEHIVEMTDVTTCLSLSLVCRALVYSSRRHAFQQLSVKVHRSDPATRSVSSEDFQKLVASPLCTFARHARSVSLGRSPASDPGLVNALQGLRFHIQIYPIDLTSTLVALPHIHSLSLLDIAEEMNVHLQPDLPVAPFESNTFSRLADLQCYMTPRFEDTLLEIFLNWILAMPRIPPVQNLGIRLFFQDPRQFSAIETVLSRLAPTLAELRLVSEPQLEEDILYLDFQVLHFAQFAHLQTVIAGPLDWGRLRENWDAADCVEDFVYEVLRAPALRHFILHFTVCASSEPAEELLSDTLRWDDLDAWIEQRESLDDMTFALYALSMAPTQLDTVLAAYRACLYCLLPKARERDILRVEMHNEDVNQ
ncbi:hypothetical protein EV714DRAFT_270289 [Schizophyllum commune]